MKNANVVQSVKRRKLFLTGGSGTLGRNLLEIIGNDPSFDILSLLRRKGNTKPRFTSVTDIFADLADRRTVSDLLTDFAPSIIVHCAATGMEFPGTEWFDLIRFNVDFTVNLCEGAARVGCSHFIFIGTGLAYRPLQRPLQENDALDTLHPYGASKAAGDCLIRAAAVEFGLPLTVLRPFSFTGLGDDRNRLFPSLLRAASSGQPFDLTSGQQVRDHLAARDVAWGILAALGQPPPPSNPGIFNLGSGSCAPVRELVEGIVAELGLPIDLRFGVKNPHRFEPEYLVADCSKAHGRLGWRPQQRLAHAVWELAKESFPGLQLHEPRMEIA